MPPQDIKKNQDLAFAFCQQTEPLNTVEHLIFIREIKSFGLYNTDKNHYKLLDTDNLNRTLFEWMVDATNKSITMQILKDVGNLMRYTVNKTTDSTMTPFIALTDKILNIETFELLPPDHNILAFYNLPIHSDTLNTPLAGDTRFEKFIDEVIVDDDGNPDRELQVVLQEMMGYYLLNTNAAQQMFFLIGEGANGKSVVLDLLRAMVGAEFTSALTIERMSTDRFGLSPLIGKKLNIVGDEESKYVKSDIFKRIISGEDFVFERKFKEPFVAPIRTKFIFSTNEAPTFSGLNTGLTRRIHIIPFKKYIPPEDRDPNLLPKLLLELPTIVNYALVGAKRLIANKLKFSSSAAINKAKIEFEHNISSALLFLSETYEESENSYLACSDIYISFQAWCQENGRKALNKQNFFKDITRKLKLPSKLKKTDGSVERCRQLKPITYDESDPEF